MGIYKIRKGDRDCSASVIDALKTAGIPVGGASYTGNMRLEFIKTGVWEWKPMSYTAHRGDLYLAEGHHVAMCSYPVKGKTTPDKLLEFSHNEVGGYYNGRVGDQLNNAGRSAESHECAYYSYPWHGILHYIGNRPDLLEDAVQIMEHLVSCPEHGYTMSSPGRNGLATGYCTVNTTGTPNQTGFTGWKQYNNEWKYLVNDVPVKDTWKLIKKVWYYFNEKGVAAQNEWINYKNHWYFLDKDCKLVTGWLKRGTNWYYLRPKTSGEHPEGSMAVGWIKPGAYWYYLRPATDEDNPEGSMARGWITVNNKSYYLRPSRSGIYPEGSMVTGSITIDGEKYKFNSNGALINQ